MTKIINSSTIISISHCRVQGSLSLEAGEWTIMGRAKNSYGWSDDAFAQQTNIKIPKGEFI